MGLGAVGAAVDDLLVARADMAASRARVKTWCRILPRVKMVRRRPQEQETTGHPRGSFDARRTWTMDRVLTVARAISVPSRLGVLRCLGNDGCHLTEAARRTGLAISTTAFHLAKLRAAGLVTKTTKGRKAIYSWSRLRWALVQQRPPAPTMPSAPAEGCAG